MTEKTEDKTEDAKRATASKREPGTMVIVDLGSKSRTQIRRLRKGEGKLFEDVLDTLAELKRTGDISEGSEEPMVVVVKERVSSLYEEPEEDDEDDEDDED
jgi:hypothetical protein